MSSETEPIAIIGIGCRFPGGVNNLGSYWRLLRDGVDAITEVPADRFDADAYYDPRPATPGKVMTRWGGWLDQIDQFDADFFGISPREAERLDPQQRLLLEVAWEALEDAGQVPERLSGRQTGVFIGQWLSDFEARLFADPRRVDFYMTTGSGRYAASGRLSYAFGFQGPGVTVDTACSSSLVAVHLACQSLRSGECSMALAGAANVILQPHITIAYSQSRMMSPDGRCKFGDVRANGYVRSEGAAVIVLKRLSQAVAEGDPIHALILGSACNNDGRSSGFLTTPGGAGQEEVLHKAYQDAGISPGQVQYVEAHGTGTSAGDPVEIGALGAVMSADRPADRPCLMGSVKTNIGHTESAAGLAGLIKVVLSLQHKLIPASLHLQQLNPNIPWDKLPVKIQSELGPWPEHTGPAIGGVSAFGIVGTNAHVVLQEAPPTAVTHHAARATHYLLPLSARTPEALRSLAQSYRHHLAQTQDELPDLCYTASVCRTDHEHRLALVARSREEMIQSLEAYLRDESGAGVSAGQVAEKRKVVFVFPGQGSQWIGMGRQLLEQEPVFRHALECCEQAIRPFVDWSLLEQLKADQAHSRLDEIDVIQPTLFAVEVALAVLWRSWGVEPDAVVGHSMGEVAAAHVAGALSLEDAARIICARSRLMKRVAGRGAMAVVELSIPEALAAIKGYEGRLSIAASNGPRSTVFSGDPDALAQVTNTLQSRQVFCRPVKVDVAAHSPHMDALRGELVNGVSGIKPQPAAIPVYSTVTGRVMQGESLDAEYWGRNLREPVLFSTAVQQLVADGYTTFIEISPHPILLPAIEHSHQPSIPATQYPITGLPSLRREQDERASMLASLGTLYALGWPVVWQQLYPDGGRCVRLPTYPWQRERFWIDEAQPGQAAWPKRVSRLLGEHIESAALPGTHLWQMALDLTTFPYLADHRVRGSVVLPAAAFFEMALEAAAQAYGAGTCHVEQVTLEEALVLAEGQSRTVQLIVSQGDFKILSRVSDSTAWTLHASGKLGPAQSEGAPEHELPETIWARCGDADPGHEHYRAMSARGLEYGPAFQGVMELWHSEDEALGRVRLPAPLAAGDYEIHPALLDVCFQLLVATLHEHSEDSYLPVQLDRLQVFARPPANGELLAHAIRRESADQLQGDVFLLDESGQVLVAAYGLQMQRVKREQAVDELLYEVVWENAKRPDDKRADLHGGWLIVGGSNIGHALVASLHSRGATCVLASRDDDFQRLLPAEFADKGLPCRGVVYVGTGGPESETAEENCVGVLRLVQALAQAGWSPSPKLWLVTSGAQAVTADDRAVSITQSPLWGLGATIIHEMPELDCTRLDLSASPTPAEIESLVHDLLSDDHEDQIALRGDLRCVARLAPARVTLHNAQSPIPNHQSPFCVETTQPGMLDHLILRATRRQSPSPGQVEIEVRETGLNFMNVMSALGIYPGVPNGVGPLGIECAGTIAAVGEGIADFCVGDEVVAIAFNSLGTHAVTDVRLVVRKPASLSFEQAATIPIAFVTAHYALLTLGHLSRDERVLIHAATGGVGLAAVQIAQHIGAEIFATAGNPEKRELLKALGVQHVMDSRSLDFGDEVMALTSGQGVDVVLNSLAGQAIQKGLESLAPYGRFVEIGKRDIYQNSQVGLFPFRKNLSYFAVDLDRMVRERPEYVGALLGQVMQLIEERVLRPLPLTVFPVAQVVEAFRHMAQARHMGKIVVSFEDKNVSVLSSVEETALVKANATYLITGGLGELGLAVARWLVENGARHLALVGRSAPTPTAKEAIAVLEAAGARTLVAQANVAQSADLEAVLRQIEQTMPELRGVIHAAGLLDDGVLLQQNAERFHAVMSPKVAGAWNLHQLTQNTPLDFFVMFSSITSTLGSPGQGNYAAANAFLDGLAHHRRAMGLPALSINWGPWGEIGLAAKREQGGTQGLAGVGLLSPEVSLQVFERLLHAQRDKAQITVMPFDAQAWIEAHPSAVRSSLLAQFRQAAKPDTRASESPASNNIRAMLLAAEPGRKRRAALETFIQEQAAQVLRLAPSRIDLRKPLRTLGMDSLMTIEFRNRVEAGLGLSLSATLVFNYPTVADLATHLAEKMGIPLQAERTVEETRPDVPNAVGPQAAPELEQLSPSDVEALLADELDEIDKLLKG